MIKVLELHGEVGKMIPCKVFLSRFIKSEYIFTKQTFKKVEKVLKNEIDFDFSL